MRPAGPQRGEPVLVVGAGIGGLALALALQRVGIPVRVFERAPVLGEVGAGLALWTSAVKLLRRLGVGEELFSCSAPIHRAEVCSRSGRRLVGLDLRPITRRHGADSYVVHRAELHAALRARLDPACVATGATFKGFRDDGDGIVAHFDGSGEARGRLLVGADGLHSAVRAALFGPAPPRYSGETCFRGVAPLAVADLHTLREVQGPAQRGAVCVLDARRVYWWTTETAPEGEADDPLARRDRLLERFRGWPYGLPEALAATPADAVLRNDLHDRPPLPRWSRGRATLLGDAAHPTTPNLGQGACMAIEDAVVLARLLAREADPRRALAAYEAERRRRSAHIVRLSWHYGRIAQWRPPAAVALREWAVRLAPRSLLERELRRQIGYDAGELPGPTGP